VNPRKGFVAVQTSNGITVFELLGGYEVNVGDKIRGDFDALGGETYYNVTESEEMDVFVQGIHCSPDSARQMMFG
jgi:hypothetical protein